MPITTDTGRVRRHPWEMPKLMLSRHSPTVDLRLVIDALPLRTRRAMLEGVEANDIIVGTYTSRDLGICPMLAAHRQGVRTDFMAFAGAWDRFSGQRKVRTASTRELRVLVAHLEASILADEDVAGEFAAAIADHNRLATQVPAFAPQPQAQPQPLPLEREVFAADALPARVERKVSIADLLPPPRPRPQVARRRKQGIRPGDPDRSRELGRRSGAGWLRPARTFEEFERTLAAAEAMLAEREARESREAEPTGV